MRKALTAIIAVLAVASLILFIVLETSGRRGPLMTVAYIISLVSIGYYLLQIDGPELMFGGRRMARGRVALLRKGCCKAAGWTLCWMLPGTWQFRWKAWTDGIEFAPIGMPSFAVRFSEMEHVGCRLVLIASLVKIVHHAPEVVRPLHFLMPGRAVARFVNALEEGTARVRGPVPAGK